MSYDYLLERALSACALLEGEAKEQGLAVVEICNRLSARVERLPGADTAVLQKELQRYVELLSRRTNKAVPLATLGRAALADLAGDRPAFQQACRECDFNLTMLGL